MTSIPDRKRDDTMSNTADQQFGAKMQYVARAGSLGPQYETDQPSAPSVSEEMGYAIGDLTDTLAKLTSRLAPVLQPLPNTVPGEGGDACMVSPMRAHLHRIHGLNENVRALLERLDV